MGNLCRSEDEAPISYEIFKEGWLNNSTSFIEGTLKKYVVVSINPCAIMVYKSENKKPHDSTAYFCLQDVDFSYDVDSLLLKFKRKRGGKDSWSFLTKDEKELKEWVNAVEEIMNKSKSSVIITNMSVHSNSIEWKQIEELKNNE